EAVARQNHDAAIGRQAAIEERLRDSSRRVERITVGDSPPRAARVAVGEEDAIRRAAGPEFEALGQPPRVRTERKRRPPIAHAVRAGEYCRLDGRDPDGSHRCCDASNDGNRSKPGPRARTALSAVTLGAPVGRRSRKSRTRTADTRPVRPPSHAAPRTPARSAPAALPNVKASPARLPAPAPNRPRVG